MKNSSLLTFRTDSGGEYLYDSNNGAVLPVNSLIKKAIDMCEFDNISKVREELLKEFSADLVDGTLNFVQRWNQNFKAFYRAEREKEEIRSSMNSFTEKDIEDYICAGNIYQMVLTLTEDCNLRCSYCYLSETYDYTRNRTTKKMSLETGIKALDYFFQFLKPVSKRIPRKHAAITFYGGEPLMVFSTMKKLVEYANEKSPVPMVYNITTNGLLLNNEIADFIVANKINIVVSLDGDRKEHNRNRLLPNGEGSFDVVFNNIKRFQSRFPNYTNIMIICVYDYKTDLESNVKFFKQNKLPLIVFLNAVSSINTNYYEKFTYEDIKRSNRQREILEMQYFDCKKKGEKPSDYLRAFFENRLVPVVLRQKIQDIPKPMIPFTGTCIPGIKFSVRADGTYDICERVNSTIPIGNVETGYNFEAMKNIITKYNNAITLECGECYASKTCPLCFAQCNKDNGFYLPGGWCNTYKENLKKYFSDVYSVLEVRKDAFKDLENRSIETVLLFA